MTMDTNAPERIWLHPNYPIPSKIQPNPLSGWTCYTRALHEAAVRKAAEADHIKTTTLTPAEQAAFESGRNAGLREAAQALINDCHDDMTRDEEAAVVRALIKDQP